MKPCLDCGRATSRGSRCARCHPKAFSGGARNAALRREVVEEALRLGLPCGLCGKRMTRDQRLQADHVVPRVAGGREERSNLRATHGSCNEARGSR